VNCKQIDNVSASLYIDYNVDFMARYKRDYYHNYNLKRRLLLVNVSVIITMIYFGSVHEQAVDYTHIAGPVYFGCKAAVQNLFDSKSSGLFTHILCVADDITKPDNLPETVTFHRIPIVNGVQNVINDDLLSQTIEYIREIWNEFTKAHTDRRLLIYSRSVVLPWLLVVHNTVVLRFNLN